MASMAGSTTLSWSCCHEVEGQAGGSRLPVGAGDAVGSNSGPCGGTQLHSVEAGDRGGSSPTASLGQWPVAGAGRVRDSGRTTFGSLSEGLLPMHHTSDLDSERWVTGARQRQDHGLVQGA